MVLAQHGVDDLGDREVLEDARVAAEGGEAQPRFDAQPALVAHVGQQVFPRAQLGDDPFDDPDPVVGEVDGEARDGSQELVFERLGVHGGGDDHLEGERPRDLFAALEGAHFELARGVRARADLEAPQRRTGNFIHVR